MATVSDGPATLRRTRDGHAFVTDGGHWILDGALSRIADPKGLASRLCGIPGVIEHGLFIGLATAVVLAGSGGVRVINQQVPAVVAITDDWNRARHAGLGGRLPMMFSELENTRGAGDHTDSGTSILDVLAATPEADRPSMVAEHVQRVVAAVFECAPSDIETM